MRLGSFAFWQRLHLHPVAQLLDLPIGDWELGANLWRHCICDRCQVICLTKIFEHERSVLGCYLIQSPKAADPPQGVINPRWNCWRSGFLSARPDREQIDAPAAQVIVRERPRCFCLHGSLVLRRGAGQVAQFCDFREESTFTSSSGEGAIEL